MLYRLCNCPEAVQVLLDEYLVLSQDRFPAQRFFHYLYFFLQFYILLFKLILLVIFTKYTPVGFACFDVLRHQHGLPCFPRSLMAVTSSMQSFTARRNHTLACWQVGKVAAWSSLVLQHVFLLKNGYIKGCN